jgi:hypothetical protein
MTLQCAPCLSDLALVRDAVTSIGGTATCTAHAVLMRYPSDDPGRRRRRLSDLRTLAESRVVDATGTEKDRLELLVQEYAVAEAMDLGAPDRTGPGRGNEPRSRRGRERRPGEPREPREGREGREGRPPREPRPDRGPRPEGGAPAGDVIAAEGGVPASSDRPTGVPSTPESGPETSAPAAGGESAPSSPPPAESAPSSPPPAESAPSSPPPSYVGNAAPSSPPPAGDGGTAPAAPTTRDDSAFGSPESS